MLSYRCLGECFFMLTRTPSNCGKRAQKHKQKHTHRNPSRSAHWNTRRNVHRRTRRSKRHGRSAPLCVSHRPTSGRLLCQCRRASSRLSTTMASTSCDSFVLASLAWHLLPRDRGLASPAWRLRSSGSDLVFPLCWLRPGGSSLPSQGRVVGVVDS